LDPRRKLLLACEGIPTPDDIGAAVGGDFAISLTSIAELRHAAAREQPDLVLIEVGASPPSATELRKLVSAARSDCPVVLLSRQPDAISSWLAAESRATGYIQRSTRIDVLFDRIDAFMVAHDVARKAELTSKPVDFVRAALASSQPAFVEANPFPFLVGAPVDISPGADDTDGLLEDPMTVRSRNAPTSRPVWMVCKVAASRPGMITVGRTVDNDIAIDHRHVSKVHAVFRERGGRFTLTDAGSKNGTWINGTRLAPKGPPSAPLAHGDTVRFADVELSFVSAAGCWERLRSETKG